MRKTIHQTPPLLRYLGYIFLFVGLGALTLLIIGLINQKPFQGQAWLGFTISLAFIFVGMVVGFDDFTVIDPQQKTIQCYERNALFRRRLVCEHPITDLPSFTIEDYKKTSSKGDATLYRIMLDRHCVRDSMSQRQANKLKDKLEQWIA